MTEDVNEFLSSIGGQAAKFPTVGTIVWGEILAADVRDQTDMESGKVLTWQDGNPRKQLVVTLQTDEQDDEEDDGVRRVYAKGNMLYAIRQALGGRRLEVGGKLAVKYTGDGEPSRRGYNPPKLYWAKYEPGQPSIRVEGEAGLDYQGEEPPYDDADAPVEESPLPF